MLPRLHVVTDATVLARGDFEASARHLIEALGVEVALHVRAHGTNARRLFDVVGVLEPVARKCGAMIVVNDRIDVALAVDARAVQLSAHSLPIHAARRIIGSNVRIGWSAHSVAEVDRAREEGADFALLGTIWPSASHPGGPVGGTILIRAAAPSGLPLIAIGGITKDRVADAVMCGAHGVAVVSAVWGTADPVRSARDLVEELKANVEHETTGGQRQRERNRTRA